MVNESIQIPDFKATPVEDIPGIVDGIRATFHSQKTRPVEFRLKQLRKFWWGLKDHEEQLLEGLHRDLNKSHFEAQFTDVSWVQNDIVYITRNLHKWAKDEKAADIALMNAALRPKIRKDPLGACLIIGAFNFPIQLAVGPMLGAIAAGNTIVLKPSEHAYHTAALLEKICRESLDPSCYTVINGGIPETTCLLAQKWDKIFFTGSVGVAKIVAKAAAVNLTPVTFELGGRNPAFVTKSADPKLAAKRLLWGKVHNAGQVCISHNYTLVDKAVLPEFVEGLKAAFAEFFPKGAKESPDLSRIINTAAFRRIKAQVDNSKGKILLGGTMEEETCFIEPTVVQVDSVDDALIVDETFGPIFTILPVENLDEAIRIANQVHDTPLALYPFGTNAEVEKVLAAVRSGGVSINDSYSHAAVTNLEFGGVGDSGTGSYRGKKSFDEFSHRRAIVTQPNWTESVIAVRYPPYEGKWNLMDRVTRLAPDFDRSGEQRGWGSWLSGGKGAATKGAGAVIQSKFSGESAR